MTDFTSYREMNGKEVKHLASVAVSNLLKEKEDFAESLAKGLISNGLIQTEFCCDKNEDEILAAVKNELLDNLSAPTNEDIFDLRDKTKISWWHKIFSKETSHSHARAGKAWDVIFNAQYRLHKTYEVKLDVLRSHLENIVGEQEEQRKYYISNEELEILKYET